jgi:hypothetical protein
MATEVLAGIEAWHHWSGTMRELIQAIDLALIGEWDQAHKIVQNIETKTAYGIHAVLHKIEGDQSNSMYWYSRAGKPGQFEMDAREELLAIRRELGGEAK